jgi:hypothetical protein
MKKNKYTISAAERHALNTLKILVTKDKKYESLNEKIAKIQGRDFQTYLRPADVEILSSTLELLDLILGHSIATYFFYECQNKDGGSVTINNLSFRIKTLEDVESFIVCVKELNDKSQRKRKNKKRS